MTEPESGEEASLFPKTAGEKLRDARIARNLSLNDVATMTRVPIRHLEAIENSDYSGLPSSTYSVGFAKAYARAVGVDEVMIGREVRGESDVAPRPSEYVPYEMNDPARLPPRGLTTVLAVVAVLLLIGAAIWYGSSWFRSGELTAPPAAAPTVAPVAAPPPVVPVAPKGGQVTLTARDTVWMRVYDGTGKTLFQGELKPGDHYDVPADAQQPMINVGRPDQLTVSVNGSVVAPLGDGKTAIKDVPISAEALLARPAAPAGAAPAGSGILPSTSGNSVGGVVGADSAAAKPTVPAAPARKPAATAPKPAPASKPDATLVPPDATSPPPPANAGAGANELPQP